MSETSTDPLLSTAPQLEPDILPGFQSETIALRPDYEGDVVATLVVRRAPVSTRRVVLYVHGYCDYFFNAELADRYNAEGVDFYAVDLRKYGRSLRPTRPRTSRCRSTNTSRSSTPPSIASEAATGTGSYFSTGTPPAA